MADQTPDLTAAIEAAARAITGYDWRVGLSSSDVPGPHQRAEARYAVWAAAPLLIEAGRRQAAAAIRADTFLTDPAVREHYARIAEGER